MAETSAMPNVDADNEYRAIEQTLLETARGRWFLAEHGRRARRLDSALLEDAIGRLSSSLKQPPPVLGLLRIELESLSGRIGEARTELLARKKSKASAESGVGDSAPQTAQAAAVPGQSNPVERMLQMAEDIHELTWTLQNEELDPQSYEAIARHASMLYAMSRQQAVESDRALKFAETLDDTSQRLAVLIDTLLHELQTYGDNPNPPPVDFDDEQVADEPMDEPERQAG
ncbi:MAG: hypothetical protein KDJ37_07145 [Hyphomicrobiaceae bacterium]|nr:hypothetical protein [Hyphomicrobiaceae bacterium]